MSLASPDEIKTLGSRIRPVLIALVSVLVFLQIVVFSPTPLETQKTPSQVIVEPQDLLDSINNQTEVTRAPGIPKDRIPEYAVEGFNYLSTKAGVKQWKLLSHQAFLYNKEKLVHGRQVTAYLFDRPDEVTVVIGQEAKYFMDARDLEVFGDVKTIFPDGFVLYSDYLRYRPEERKIEIPKQYPVRGEGEKEKGKKISFESGGLDFALGENLILLPKDVVFNMKRMDPPGSKRKKKDSDDTTIVSDRAQIDRNRQISYFTMDPQRPLKQRFVHVTQPSLFVRARRVNLNYGELPDVLKYMEAHEDVFIEETGETQSFRYGTCGRADFDTKENLIILTQYPQVYQDRDTVTGEMITIHRDTDIVEVKHSNAFSRGQ